MQNINGSSEFHGVGGAIGIMNAASSAVLRTSLLLACAAFGACSETIDTTYKTRAEAEFAGAVSAGWVPEWLPQEAMQIREAHSTGTKAMMIRFTFPPEREVNVPSTCLLIVAAAAEPPPFERAWWPKSVPEAGNTMQRYEYRRCEYQYVAVLRSEGVGFVWSAQ